MGVKGLYRLLSLVLVLLLVVAYLYLKDSSSLKEVRFENIRMSQKIEESALKQKDAIVQKRISEQLEEIAQQQKLITENQKTIALEQRAIAEQKQDEAIYQKQIADRAKTRAVDALKDAEKQRKNAIRQKDAAEAAEKNANRLRMLALGQSLSARSINQKNTGNDTLATMLALAAWRFTRENKGDLYQSELFQALKMSSAEENSLRAHKGFIRDIAVMPGASGQQLKLASVSQSGEIILWGGPVSDLQPFVVLDDAEYDFRKILFNPAGTAFIATDIAGNALMVEAPFQNSGQYKIKLSDTKVKALAFINNNSLVFSVGSNLVGLDIRDRGSSVSQVYGHAAEIEQLIFDHKSGKLFFSDNQGKVFSFTPGSGSEARLHCQLGSEDISSVSIGDKGRIAIGTTSGKIYVYHGNESGLKELVGHLSQVNDLVFDKDLLMSVSYDRTVRLWNLNKPSLESITIEEHDDWGYSIDVIPGAEKIISAGADRLLRITTIDPEKLAELVSKRVTRDFSREEWEAYVGSSVEYQSLKQ